MGSQTQWNPPTEQLPQNSDSLPVRYHAIRNLVSTLPEPLRSDIDAVLPKYLNAVKQLPKGGDASTAWGIIATVFDKNFTEDPHATYVKKQLYLLHGDLLDELDKV